MDVTIPLCQNSDMMAVGAYMNLNGKAVVKLYLTFGLVNIKVKTSNSFSIARDRPEKSRYYSVLRYYSHSFRLCFAYAKSSKRLDSRETVNIR